MGFYVERAARLNRHFMRREILGWGRSFDDIAALLGFTDRSPSEWEFAEAVERWQKKQRYPLLGDGVIGPNTWTQMQRQLGAGRFSRPALTAEFSTTVTMESPLMREGPQSFAPAVPGTTTLDAWLVQRNMQAEQNLVRAADEYFARGDFRWFFASAHAQITRLINRNLNRFQRPNALLKLNMHFAEEFLRAVDGQPHDGWKRAFQACRALQNTSAETSALVGEVEFCGAAMANVHIRMDLSAALNEVGCIPPEDYGNMLIFVNRGALAALVRLRGQALGAAEAVLQQFAAPLVDLEVKTWRNTVYNAACNADVPDPSPTFMTAP